MDIERNPITEIINCLVKNKNIRFKNQQREEADLSDEEKFKIAEDIYNKSKLSFLIRFGSYLTREELEMFTPTSPTGERTLEDAEVKVMVASLIRIYSERVKGLKTKNRRYEALKQLINEKSYFSETEMMKRNPLLYEQLVGQYLNDAERKERDRIQDNDTLVKILLEGMERDEAYSRKKQQEEYEDDAMEESDSDYDENDHVGRQEPKPSTSRWGEFPDLQEHRISEIPLCSNKKTYATQQEKQLLRNEFTTIMYANFLDGHDDFDYTTVDDNDAYDNIDILQHDEEDKYFDSEEPEEVAMEEDGGNIKDDDNFEDELDIYMNALNQHPSVIQLAKELQKL